jgi:hypothetical protein
MDKALAIAAQALTITLLALMAVLLLASLFRRAGGSLDDLDAVSIREAVDGG